MTELHFLNYDMTIKVGRSGVTMTDGDVEHSVVIRPDGSTTPELKQIAPAGYYRQVQMPDKLLLYYIGEAYEPIGDAQRSTIYKDSWELTDDETVFEY